MNEYILIVVRARTQAFNMKRILTDNNIVCEMVNTPKEVMVGCGLSIKIENKYYEKAKNLCQNNNSQSLVGIYKINVDYNKNRLSQLLWLTRKKYCVSIKISKTKGSYYDLRWLCGNNTCW